ncbi:spore coat protein [Clostridiaceae bacterium NSJ-31]|uniref:Spore coat protein n=1 Tax=Ligaoa zhengdingensis TaxID=2763658 RepID=A0A926DXX4_9FIRM|nr:spore coat protein [Ligaoa zhengdingensis]MBC8545938.1 spore coat protein [Ligaoa zhengdingensis]
MASITSKELSAIEDQLSAEQTLIKKYKMYAQSATDPQLKSKCEQVAAKHQDHFNKLMGHLS